MEEIKFNSLLELKDRLKPALCVKEEELKRNQIKTITEEDLFSFYRINYFEKGNNLNLYDMVEIILHTPLEEILTYFINTRKDN